MISFALLSRVPCGSCRNYYFQFADLLSATIYVDSKLVWAAGTITSNITLAPDTWHELEIEYTGLFRSSLALEWKIPDRFEFQSMSEAQILCPVGSMANNPFEVLVLPSNVDFRQSLVVSNFSSMQVAGTSLSYSITLKDSYGNLITRDQSDILITIIWSDLQYFSSFSRTTMYIPGQSRSQQVSYQPAGYYSDSVFMTRATEHSMYVSLLASQSLYATYYDSPDLDPAFAVKSASVPDLDFSAAAGSSLPGSSISNYAGFSI
eukprot:621730-Hanusia_phi.AAC.1